MTVRAIAHSVGLHVMQRVGARVISMTIGVIVQNVKKLKPAVTALGFVYLLKSGPYYKIGRTTDFERRFDQIKLQMPFSVEVMHKIETEDPEGIEAYWHRRFD